MALVGRMREWRDVQRRKAGGMVQLTTWVPQRSAEYLRDIFARLADPGERGDDYRLVVARWPRRRRVVAQHCEGTDFSAEIDLPFLGPHWYMQPAGGRVTGPGETWIELTPAEAGEVSSRCKNATSDALAGWLREHDLLGKLRDHTGVALDTDFASSSYPARDDDSLMRPDTEEAFLENEARIARELEREALRSRKHPTDDPTVVEYEGAFGVPSRCHALHRREGDRVLFALGHIRHGGTSPTNMIGELATRMRARFYPDMPAERIEWFDCWSGYDTSFGDGVRIARVHLQCDTRGRYTDPQWSHGPELPEDFRAEITRVLEPGAAVAAEKTQAR